MVLIVGLGNPGREYVDTRHNIGFEAVSVLSSYYNIPLRKIKHQALLGDGRIGGEKVILAQPQTFMNNSGISVRAIMEYYHLTPKELIVIFDEAALPAGRIRIRPHGSAGGHNGMKSIIYQIQSDDFIRIRLGIGKAEGDLADHVLGRFTKEEIAVLAEAMKNMPAIIQRILQGELEEAMNRYNRAEL